MNFLQKNPLYLKLQDPSALEADGLLLQKKNPKARSLSLKSFDKVKLQKEILYELLDYATEEEIINNRKGIKAPEKAPEKADAVKQMAAPVKKKSGNKKGSKRR
jgi:hypothetical protein